METRVVGQRIAGGIPKGWQPLCRLAVLGFLFTAVAGCDAVQNAWRSDEERINAAHPMSAAVAHAREKLEAKLPPDDPARAGLEGELSARAKLRAIGCAKGYSPTLFTSAASIRERVGNDDCFARFDGELVEWLNARRLQRLLTGPALRPIPTEVPSLIAASQAIGQVRFASSAGVALVTANRVVEVIDLSNGESLFIDKGLSFYPTFAEISPNGALFAIPNTSATQAGVTIRDSLTGETVAEFADYQRLVWIDSTIAAVTRANSQGLELHDFASGNTTVVKGVTGTPARILAVPDQPSTFVAVSSGSLLKFRVDRKHERLEIALLERAPGPTVGDANGETAAGKQVYMQGAGDLWSTDIAGLRTTRISFKPVQVVSATALPDPAEVLLALSMRGRSFGNSKLMVYSTLDGSFEQVEDDRVTGPSTDVTGYPSSRTVFVSSLKQVVVISGPTLKPVADIKRGARYSTESLLQQLQVEDRERLEKEAMATAQRLGYQSAGSFDGVAVMKGPVAELARNAQIEAVGVYESAGGSHGVGKPRVSGPVHVILRRSSKPVVLVLSSYEPVNWKIANNGANLKAVLLASAYDSTVEGAGAARVVQIGSMHAYERSGHNYGALQQEVIRWSGKGIDVFQGKYSGSTFTVGGN